MNKASHFSIMLRMSLSYWRKKTKLRYLPIRLWIEPTNICNLKCVMCPQSTDTSKRKGYMDFSLFKKIIDEAKRFIYDANLHHTGESLLHPQIFEMIRYAKSSGIYTRLHTNATLLTEEKSQRLIDSGLDFIAFSFDGYDRETYEKIRIGANFDNTLQNIKGFLSLKQSLSQKTPFTVFETMEFTETGSEENERKREKFKEELLSLYLNKFVVKYPHNWAGNYSGPEGSSDDYKRSNFSACTFPWYTLVIFWDGTVLPCPQDFYGKLKLGSVAKSPIVHIWNNSEIVNLRKKMGKALYKDLLPCRSCDMLWRRKFLGIPASNLKAFIRENLFRHS